MNTLKDVLTENYEFKSLINAVIGQLGGIDRIKDINNHGIQGGYDGFIYYDDTHKFAMKNRKQIVKLLEQKVEILDSKIVKIVSELNVFLPNPMDSEDKAELYKYLGFGKCEQSIVTNLMAWFAAKSVCRMFES